VTPARWFALLVFLGALLFAVQGGEYSTTALWKLRRDERTEAERIAVLRREVDSLARVAKLVETDPATQERIAREQHGMLKPGEHAFVLEVAPGKEP
jgi:cell division protein FtsB